MCLYDGKAAKIRTGYKMGVYNKDANTLRAFYDTTKCGLWIAAKCSSCIYSNTVEQQQYSHTMGVYFPGFHIFKYKTDAMRYYKENYNIFCPEPNEIISVFKCEYAGILADGLENDGYESVKSNYRTIVAAIMKLDPTPLT